MKVMIDIETLATTADATIVSIGACSFDKTGIIDRFYRECHLNQQRHICSGTIAWWFTQAPKLTEKKVSLKSALLDLKEFCTDLTEVWANSPSFDCTILESAYKECKTRPPWRYSQQRDYRTMMALGYTPTTINPMAHNALEDAEVQTIRLLEVLNQLPTGE